MVCPKCGATIAEGSEVCPACSGHTDSSFGDPTRRSAPARPPLMDGYAITSIILGALALFPFSFITGIPAVIFGHVGRSRVRRSQGRRRGRGMALTGLLMGYCSIVLAVGIGGRMLIKTRSEAHDSEAQSNIRKVSTLIATYRLTYGEYPAALAVMGPAGSGSPSASAANLLRVEELSDMASGRSGYIYTYQRTSEGYTLRADPASFGSGVRHFYIDQTGSLRFEDKQQAGPASSILG